MSHLKVKFDWNKNLNTSSSGVIAAANRSQEDKVLLDSGGPPSKGSFGSGLTSAFTSTTSSPSHQYCCLTEEGKRCDKIVGNASYNKRIQKIVQQKRLRLSIDSNARHVYICDYHKNMIQSVRGPLGPLPTSSASGVSGKRKRKDDDHDFLDDINDHSDMAFQSSFYDDFHDGRKEQGMTVDLASLQVNTLRRYKKHFHVPAKPGLNKQQLAETVYRHFKSIPVNEKEAITFFIYMIKTNKNKLDREKGDGGGSSLS